MNPQTPDSPPASPQPPGPPAPKFSPGQAAAGACVVLGLSVFIVLFESSQLADLGISLFFLLPFISLLLVIRPRTRSFGLGLLLTWGLFLLCYLTICGGVTAKSP